MSRKLSWVKEAFSREISIVQDDQIVGRMYRNAFSQDVDAHLHQTNLRFDVTGFLVHSVTIHDLSADNRIIGTIAFSFGKRAELKLVSGESYTWKRHNVLMREWGMIQGTTDHAPETEVVSYDLTQRFFEEHGDILVDESGTATHTDLVILTGLFIRNYFLRRRRIAAAGVAGASASVH